MRNRIIGETMARIRYGVWAGGTGWRGSRFKAGGISVSEK